jgi:hypothetical protein
VESSPARSLVARASIPGTPPGRFSVRVCTDTLLAMKATLDHLSFYARQAVKEEARLDDARALAAGTKTAEQIKKSNYWFYGLLPEQIRVGFNSSRDLY